ncbi:hypothetical protein CRYUN_Cryun14cG0090100 [Craigia yunnanensis]
MSSAIMEEAVEEESHIEVVVPDSQHQLIKGNNPSLQILCKQSFTPGDQGGRHSHSSQAAKWSVIFQLAFQSIGIVYGDIGTSPLYVFSSTFTDGIHHRDDILGVPSLIFYTLTLIPLIKYVFIVLRATDNGQGGTFALYSLICRYAKVSLISNQQPEDSEVSDYKLELPNKRLKLASALKSNLENSQFAKLFLLLITMLGTSMVIGDGVITPSMSVLSAMSGIKEATSAMTEDRIVWSSIAILVCLFNVQRFGTDKVGYGFAPILCVWFTFIAGIGVYNFIKFDPTVIKAINPKYIVDFFKRNKCMDLPRWGRSFHNRFQKFCSLRSEALFADVGHFTVRSIQLSMCTVTYPAVFLAYIGQASFLRKHENFVSDTFYKSIPGPLYWPMFVVAVAAAIIASQAMISGVFSIIQQSLSLRCFPRVKIVHTSAKYEGQVYIPEVNYVLMLACIGVTAGFKTTVKIGNAYGIAVVFVMTLTSSLLVLIMIMIWKTNILLVIAYVLIIGSIELVYLSSVLYKFDQGGYLPLAFAAVLMTVMYVWNNVYRRKYSFELDHKISFERLKEITANKNLYRIPGLAMFYSELVYGIPPIFEHYVPNVPALHSVLVFVTIKSLPINRRNEQESFESTLVERLKEFIKENIWLSHVPDSNGKTTKRGEESKNGLLINGEDGENEINARQIEEDWQEIVEREAWQAGAVHFIGESEVIASKGAGIGKRILIDYAYNFLKKNLRRTEKVFDIPHSRMLKVGMIYEL